MDIYSVRRYYVRTDRRKSQKKKTSKGKGPHLSSLLTLSAETEV